MEGFGVVKEYDPSIFNLNVLLNNKNEEKKPDERNPRNAGEQSKSRGK